MNRASVSSKSEVRNPKSERIRNPNGAGRVDGLRPSGLGFGFWFLTMKRTGTSVVESDPVAANPDFHGYGLFKF
jgi:hypothetical protein